MEYGKQGQGQTPVKRIEGLEHRKSGQSNTPLDTPILTLMRLALHQTGQIVDMEPLLRSGLLK